MFGRLTYIFSLAFAACLVSSCGTEVPVKGGELSFAVSDESRAGVTAGLNFEGSEFAVYGDMKYAGSSSYTVIFNGDKVSYGNSGWVYSNPQYWFPKHEHSFVAVHPAGTDEVSNASYQNDILSFVYTLPEDYKEATDLLAATHRRMYDGATPALTSPVMLKFTHIMSRINFILKNDKAAETVRVNKIELEGIGKSGKFVIVPAPLPENVGQTDDYSLSWTGIGDKGTLIAGIAVEVPENETQPLFPDSDALFVIPQPDNGRITMKISITLFYKNGKTEDRTLEATEYIGWWKPGKVYTYSLTLTDDIKLVEVNVSVNDWKTGSDDDVQVPRK